jgi:HlyD family secretion protein
MKRPSFTRIVLPLLALGGILIAVVLIATSQPDRALEAPSIQPPTTPQAQRATGTVAGAGLVEPSTEIIEIGTPVGGIVEAVDVTVGDRVAKGQPLFRIDTRDAVAAVREGTARAEASARAADAARTALDVARRQLALYTSASDSRAVSRLELVDREGAVATARAQALLARAEADAARAEVERLRVDLARRTVRAPIAGQIVQVRVRTGEFASAGPGQGVGTADPLMQMGGVDPLHVRIDIDEDEADRVAIGSAAVISARGDAARRVTATFVRAEPLVIPKRSLTNNTGERVDVRVLQLVYALPADGHTMRVGQQVDAFVPARAAGAR